jgi:N-acyl-D-amino-acid deacylase
MRSEARYPMWWRPSQDDAAGRFTLLDSLREVIRVGEVTGATIVATHLKVRGVDFWGASQAAIDLVREARDRGIAIYGDQYPYDTSFSDGLIVLVPDWAIGYDGAKAAHGTVHKDYATSLETTLSDPAQAAKVRQDVEHAIAFRGGPERITIMDSPDRALIGKTLAEIAAARAMTAVDAAIRLQLDGERTKPGGVRARSFSFADADIVAFMREPWVATATDAEISLPEDGPVHVRNYGTFVRKIAEYSLARHNVAMEDAVRAATGLPAQILGLTDRGCLRPGCAADLLVIDPERLRELGTFMDPHRYPVGIERVFVAGEAVIANGEPTGALPGRVLTRQ